MAWVKIDDQFADHPKIREVGPIGMAIQVAALCYCNRFLTDGVLKKESAKALVTSLTRDKNFVKKMVSAGLWDEHPEGYIIHDYLEYNPSKTEVLDTRERRSEAGRIGGETSAKSKQSAKQMPSKDSSKIQAKVNPVPVPKPLNPDTNCPVPAIPPVSPQAEPEQGGQGEVVLSSGNGAVKTIGEVLQPIGFQRVHLTPEQKEQAWREKREADAKLVAESLVKYKAEREAENVKPIPTDEKEAVQWWIDEFTGLIPNATDEIRAKLHARLINIKDKEQIHVIFNDLSLYMQEHHVERPAGLILNRLWNVSKGLS